MTLKRQTDFNPPDPILDARELELIRKLASEYEKFTSPGPVARSFGKTVSWTQDQIVRITPEKLLKLARDAVDTAQESELIKMALTYASRGFGELTKQAGRFTLSPDGVVQTLRDDGHSVANYEEICGMRSYHIERSLSKREWKDRLAALVEGAVTGAPGFPGIPFNITLSFLLFFRAAQSTALYYGYDVHHDPRELQFASEVTVITLEPNLAKGAETLGGLIGKMMLAAELSALSRGLSKTYAQMAERGGAQLLYVQIRALANKAAEKALKKSGQSGLEAGVFRNLLEQIGKRLPKDAGKKAMPLVGAILGAGFDSYLMHRVLTGANLIYHKRFLHEKEARIQILQGIWNGKQPSKTYMNVLIFLILSALVAGAIALMLAGHLSGGFLLLILIILVLFGAKKLPELARGMGQAVREFQKRRAN